MKNRETTNPTRNMLRPFEGKKKKANALLKLIQPSSLNSNCRRSYLST